MMNRPRHVVAALALLALAPLCRGEELLARDAWVRLVPPVSRMTAAYLVLENGGSKDDALTGADTPSAAMIELHRTLMSGGVASMVEQKSIPVPAGGETVLRPGDYHLMIMGLHQPVNEGDVMAITLRFASGRQLELEAVVRSAAPSGGAAR